MNAATRSRVVLSIALAIGVWTGGARADAEADAKDLFARGRELRARGNCAAAVEDFRKAVAIYPAGLGSVRNLAECEEQLGHFASARRAWLDLKRGLLTVRDPKYANWDGDAEAAAARLAPKVAHMTVEVVVARPNGEPAPEGPRDVEVRIDGEALPSTLVGTALERDPGTYRVEATRAGSSPARQTVVVAAGEDRRVSLRIIAEAPPANAVALPARPDEGVSTRAPEDPKRGRRLAGWVSVGVGGAALVGAAVALAVRQSAIGELDTACASHVSCSPDLQSTVSRGRLASTLVNVLGSVGILATGAGVALVMTSPPPRTGFVVGPSVGAINGVRAAWSVP